MSQIGLELPCARDEDDRSANRPDHASDSDNRFADVKARVVELFPADRTDCDLAFLRSELNRQRVAGEPGYAIATPVLIQALQQLADEGRVIEGRHFYGSHWPGTPDYRGFKPLYRLAQPAGTSATATPLTQENRDEQ